MATLFNRNFNINIGEKDELSLELEITMKDMYHDFDLTMEVDRNEYYVQNVNLVLNKRPKEKCEELKLLVKKMEGAKIGKGFIKTVTSTLGGNYGCPNLINLFLISAPLALNASALAYKRDNNLSEEEMEDVWNEVLGGVCLAYPTSKK